MLCVRANFIEMSGFFSRFSNRLGLPGELRGQKISPRISWELAKQLSTNDLGVPTICA